MEWLPIAAALICTGVLAGLLAGLLGVGGGIVIVPVLFFIFQFLGISAATAMSVATATSLSIIVPTSYSAVRSHWRRGNVLLPIIKFWTPFMVLGVVVGVVFATSVGGGAGAITVFGVVAILFGFDMLFRAHAKALFDQLPGKAVQAFVASLIGAICSIMGIGGGTLGVTFLTTFNTPAHRAVGTSAVFSLIIALPAAFLLLFASTPADAPLGTVGRVNLFGFLLIVPLTVFMAPLGVRLGAKLNGARLKQVFAVFLLISGSRMLYQVIG